MTDQLAGFRIVPIAEVAQLVERNLAKVEVAGSSPVFRSSLFGDVAEWLGAGLQNPSLRFNSGRRLQTFRNLRF